MCYYNGIKISHDEFLRLNDVEKELQIDEILTPVQNGFTYPMVYVIKPDPNNCSWDIVQMEWGFIPYYIRNRDAVQKFRFGYSDDNGKFHPPLTTLNAVGEDLLLPNKMYRESALRRRCLLLSPGFYEWRHIPQIGKKGKPLKTTVKIPYHIKVRDKNIFFMAAIWQPWTDKETGETIDTCAVVTTKANELMEQVHNSKKRMPVILNEEIAGEWISDSLNEKRISEIASFQYPSQQMEAWSIRKDFQTASDPTERFLYPNLSELVL